MAKSNQIEKTEELIAEYLEMRCLRRTKTGNYCNWP